MIILSSRGKEMQLKRYSDKVKLQSNNNIYTKFAVAYILNVNLYKCKYIFI